MKILRELRKEKNLTIAKTAEFLNMPFETYRSYEAGKNQADYETLVKLADFSVSRSTIFSGVNQLLLMTTAPRAGLIQ